MELGRDTIIPGYSNVQVSPAASYNMPHPQQQNVVQPMSRPPAYGGGRVAPMNVPQSQAYGAAATATTATTGGTSSVTVTAAVVTVVIIIGGVVVGVVVPVINNINNSGSEAITSDNAFTCPGTSTQILKTKVCDGTEDCTGGTDEDRCITATGGFSGGTVMAYLVSTNSHHPFCGYADGWTDEKSNAACAALGLSSSTATAEADSTEVGIALSGSFALNEIVQSNTTTCTNNKIVEITCTAPTSCGRKNRNGKIVGGADAAIEDHPWQVALLETAGGSTSQFCGGTIVASNWVVTAAHCVEQTSSSSTYKVLAGSSTIVTTDSLTHTIDKIVYHPSYSSTTSFMDIAVLHVSTSFTYSDSVQPACLPTPGQVFTDQTSSIVSGWGVTTEGGSAPTTLQAVTVPMYNGAGCKSTFPNVASMILDGMICAGLSEGGKDSCQGDSGGPLMVAVDSTHFLVGATSFGIGCARPSFPGVYAEIAYAVDWIEREMAKGA